MEARKVEGKPYIRNTIKDHDSYSCWAGPVSVMFSACIDHTERLLLLFVTNNFSRLNEALDASLKDLARFSSRINSIIVQRSNSMRGRFFSLKLSWL